MLVCFVVVCFVSVEYTVTIYYNFAVKMNKMSGLSAQRTFSNNISFIPHNDPEGYMVLFSPSLICEN